MNEQNQKDNIKQPNQNHQPTHNTKERGKVCLLLFLSAILFHQKKLRDEMPQFFTTFQLQNVGRGATHEWRDDAFNRFFSYGYIQSRQLCK